MCDCCAPQETEAPPRPAGEQRGSGCGCGEACGCGDGGRPPADVPGPEPAKEDAQRLT